MIILSVLLPVYGINSIKTKKKNKCAIEYFLISLSELCCLGREPSNFSFAAVVEIFWKSQSSTWMQRFLFSVL